MSATESSVSPTRTVDGRPVPAPGTYALDGSHTNVGFTVRHLMVSKVRGRFENVEGSITIADAPEQSSVQVTVGLDSINTNDEGRDAHLRSADFFNAETHPTMEYASTAVRADGSDWVVDGNLTLNGITKPLTLKVEFEGATVDPWNNLRVGFSATGELDREEWGVSWNQSLETGGVLVGKTVKLELDAEAVQPQG